MASVNLGISPDSFVPHARWLQKHPESGVVKGRPIVNGRNCRVCRGVDGAALDLEMWACPIGRHRSYDVEIITCPVLDDDLTEGILIPKEPLRVQGGHRRVRCGNDLPEDAMIAAGIINPLRAGTRSEEHTSELQS